MNSPSNDPNLARYQRLMARVRDAHRSELSRSQPSDTRWDGIAARAKRGEHPAARQTSRWLRPAIAIAALAIAVGGIALYDMSLDRTTTSGLAVVTPHGGAGLWHAEGAPLQLAFVGGHTITLADAAVLEVAESTDALFDGRVASGSVSFAVAPRRAGDLFRVRFGADYLEVRGTAFTVTVSEGASGPSAAVRVEHGIVEVFSAGVSTLVRANGHWASADVTLGASTTSVIASAEIQPAAARADVAVEPIAPAASTADKTEAVVAPVREVAAREPMVLADDTPARKSVVTERRREVPPVKATRPTTKVVELAPQTSPIVGVEPLSATVEHALLVSMRTGDCARVERALASIIRTQGAAASGEAWWMRAWCARSRGDAANSVRWFEKARGKARWPIPDATTLPAVPAL